MDAKFRFRMCRESILIVILAVGFLLPIGRAQNLSPIVEAIADSPVLIHGEAPHWDAKTQSLFVIDRFSTNVSLHRFDFTTKVFYAATILQNGVIQIQPSFVIPLEKPKNRYAIGIDNSVKLVDWNGVSPTANVVDVLIQVEQANGNKTHFNDAKADSEGRFYGGTMSIKVCNFATNVYGGLYERSKKNGLKILDDRIKVSNGLTWDEDLGFFYYVDSCTLTIKVFDYNKKTGEIKNGRVAYDYSKGDVIPFIPDGMTIDLNGTLYNALYQGSAIAVVDPRTKTMNKINVPVQAPTSVTFGGPDLNIMFLTTCFKTVDAFTGADIEHDNSEPDAGKIFMITGLGRTGRNGDKLIV